MASQEVVASSVGNVRESSAALVVKQQRLLPEWCECWKLHHMTIGNKQVFGAVEVDIEKHRAEPDVDRADCGDP